MKAKNFDIRWLEQFHQEHKFYPGKKGQQLQGLWFRKFAGRKKEIAFLATSISEKLNDREIISSLTRQLEKENIPGYFRLSSAAFKLRRKAAAYVMLEQMDTTNYKRLLSVLDLVIPLIEDFHAKVQQVLLYKLKALQHIGNVERRTALVNRRIIDDLMTNMKHCYDHLQHYYQDLNSCIHKDSDNLPGVVVTTYTEQYIVDVLLLIEKLMTDTRSTQALLEKWKTRLAERELQVVYN